MVEARFADDYRNSYHPECAAVSISNFNSREAEDYDPSKADYYEDVSEENVLAGSILAILCLGVFLLLCIFGCVICCMTHHWNQNADFIATVRIGQRWWQRLIALIFILAIFSVAAIITSMSIWGIVKVEQDVKEVVPNVFNFVESTEDQVDSIYRNLTDAVHNGNRIIGALRQALAEFRQNQATRSFVISAGVALEEVERELEETLIDAAETLGTVDREVNENLKDLLDGMRDAIGYRDEGEGINDGGRIAIIFAFSLFILFALGSSIFSLYGVSPRCIMFWATLMWFMLFIAFGFVGFLDVGKEISRDTCLYIDTYAVRELRDEVERDEVRTEELLWYYFGPPGTGDKNLTELEKLWSFPLTRVASFLDFAQEEVYDASGALKVPYSAVGPTTRVTLESVYGRIPQARADVEYVQELIQGEIFQNIHAGVKDIICCTEYDAVETIWTAWVVSSAFGLLLAVLMTIQGLQSLRCSAVPQDGGLPIGRHPTLRPTSYMGPPVEEQRYGSDLPLRPSGMESTGVYYPEIQMPETKRY